MARFPQEPVLTPPGGLGGLGEKTNPESLLGLGAAPSFLVPKWSGPAAGGCPGVLRYLATIGVGGSSDFRINLVSAPSHPIYRQGSGFTADFVPGHSGGTAAVSHRLPSLSLSAPTPHNHKYNGGTAASIAKLEADLGSWKRGLWR